MPRNDFLRVIAQAAALLVCLSRVLLANAGEPEPDTLPPPRQAAAEPSEETPPPPPPLPGNEPASGPAFDGPSPLAGPLSNLMSPVVGHYPYHADFRTLGFADVPVSGQSTNLGYWQQDFSLGVPIWQDCRNEWSASANVRAEFFHTGAILPTTDQPFPDELWSVRFGTTFRHLFDNGWIAGSTVSVGSASDKPFHSIDEMTAGLNAFLRIPSGEHNAWLFTLNYSVTGELPFPVPGVAYVWQPSDCFRANIGLPFMLWYRPIDDLTLDLSYMLLRNVHARVTYRLCPLVSLHTGYDWSNESYFLVDRPDVNDRFFSYDQRLTAGALFHLSRAVSLDFSAGFVFDRYYYEGHSSTSGEFNRINIGNGPFGAFDLRVRW
jgi:hypothetical protein